MLLRARGVGIDLLLCKQGRSTVYVRGDVDRHQARRAGTARAVIDADADRPRGAGGRGGVGVGQVFDQGLDCSRGGRCVEADDQVGTVCTTAEQGADGDATIADHISGNADLARCIPLVADAELVLVAQVFG